MNNIASYFRHPIYDYDKPKVDFLKAILPFIIIIHHIAPRGFPELKPIGAWGDTAMYLFFAMSGYGLIISFLKNPNYLDGFLKKSLSKLFIPYLIALIMFIIYRAVIGIDQIELLKAEGLFSFVPTSWFIYVLSLFYVCFYFVFKYLKTNNFIRGGYYVAVY